MNPFDDRSDEEYFRQLEARFCEFHRDNPRVWELFEIFAHKAVAAGKTRISAWLIINLIRWEVFLQTVGAQAEDFKISNDFISFYARLWRHRYPENKELFSIHRMRGEPFRSYL